MPDSSTMAFVLLAVVVVGLVIIIAPYWWQKRKEGRERTQQLQIVAGQRGWTFVASATLDSIRGAPGFGLFAKGHSKTIENLMSGEADSIKIDVFDYLYVSDHGEEDHRGYAQTVIFMESSRLAVPCFSLQPENVLHKLFSAHGYQDIDFEQRPGFSKQFLLRGEDETAIRKTFNDQLLAFYELHPGTSTEGKGNQLLVYRDDQRLETTQVQQFIEFGLKILNLMRRQV